MFIFFSPLQNSGEQKLAVGQRGSIKVNLQDFRVVCYIINLRLDSL